MIIFISITESLMWICLIVQLIVIFLKVVFFSAAPIHSRILHSWPTSLPLLFWLLSSSLRWLSAWQWSFDTSSPKNSGNGDNKWERGEREKKVRRERGKGRWKKREQLRERDDCKREGSRKLLYFEQDWLGFKTKKVFSWKKIHRGHPQLPSLRWKSMFKMDFSNWKHSLSNN